MKEKKEEEEDLFLCTYVWPEGKYPVIQRCL